MPAYDNLDGDYDDDYADEGFRWMSVIVLLLAVAGFFSLAWYAYETGTQQPRVRDVIVIEGEEGALKMAPDAPGGAQFDHQDKSIYDVLGEGEEPLHIEGQLVIEMPQEPVVTPRVQAESWVREQDEAKRAAEEAEELIAIKKAEEEALNAKAEALEKALDNTESSETKPAPQEVQTYVAPKAAPKPVPPARKPVAPKVAPKPIVANVASYANSYKVQLGAFRSQADAEAQWQKIRSSHLDLLNGKPYQIVRADLGAKGIYYRLRAGGAPSEAAAKSLCKTLDARKQPCLYVGK